MKRLGEPQQPEEKHGLQQEDVDAIAKLIQKKYTTGDDVEVSRMEEVISIPLEEFEVQPEVNHVPPEVIDEIREKMDARTENIKDKVERKLRKLDVNRRRPGKSDN